VSPDWFDPLGLRGSRLDPFAMFAAALRGEGLAQQSAEVMATTIIRRMVGRRVEINCDPPISATVDRIDEAVPATALAAMPTLGGEVPMWKLVRGRIRDVRVGGRALSSVDLTATGVWLLGATAQRLRVDHLDFNATVSPDEMERWAGDIDGGHLVRLREGRLEVSDRRVARWAWLEVSVTAAEQTVVVTPIALRILGRNVPMLGRLRRPVERDAPWLPAELIVNDVRVTDQVVGVRGELAEVAVSVDVPRLFTELGAQGSKSVLRIVVGDR
jgi:DUF2993 family protein